MRQLHDLQESLDTLEEAWQEYQSLQEEAEEIQHFRNRLHQLEEYPQVFLSPRTRLAYDLKRYRVGKACHRDLTKSLQEAEERLEARESPKEQVEKWRKRRDTLQNTLQQISNALKQLQGIKKDAQHLRDLRKKSHDLKQKVKVGELLLRARQFYEWVTEKDEAKQKLEDVEKQLKM